MRCAGWYNLYNLKNVKYNHEGVLVFVACNFPKSSTTSWVFSRFLNFTDGTTSCNAPQTSVEDFNNEIETRI